MIAKSAHICAKHWVSEGGAARNNKNGQFAAKALFERTTIQLSPQNKTPALIDAHDHRYSQFGSTSASVVPRDTHLFQTAL